MHNKRKRVNKTQNMHDHKLRHLQLKVYLRPEKRQQTSQIDIARENLACVHVNRVTHTAMRSFPIAPAQQPSSLSQLAQPQSNRR